MPVKIRELIRMIEKEGWVYVRTKGDHRIYRRPDGRTTVISGHLGDDVRPGTHNQADWIKETERMTRKYSLMMEGDSNGYSAYVPELPTILVTGKSPEEVERRATEAIQIYLEEIHTIRSTTAVLHEIEVVLPS